MITASCSNCQATFNLKDEFAGKKGKCSNCQNIFSIPAKELSEVTIAEEGDIAPSRTIDNPPVAQVPAIETGTTAYEHGIFKSHIYGIKQKRIAINEKYYIKNTENSDIFFSIRRIYFWKTFGAIMAGIVVFFILFLAVMLLLWDFGVGAFFIWLAVTCAASAATMIALSPRRHIEFFFSEKDAENHAPEFIVSQDKKIEFPNQNYTLRDATGNSVAKFRKNIFTDILRKTWHIEYAGKHIVVKEDSIILGLLRRFMPFGKLIRTNFVFLDITHDIKSSQIIGYFKRKFELFDNYSLDMTSDPAYIIPRQFALCTAVLLDTWEKR